MNFNRVEFQKICVFMSCVRVKGLVFSFTYLFGEFLLIPPYFRSVSDARAISEGL